jgi:large subunit ribosomal protein L10
MALTRQQKEQTVQEVQQDIAGATSVVFMAFDGLTISDVTELRDLLAAEGVSMRVMPKRLLRLVVKNANIDFDPQAHEGQVALVWGSDTVAPARILHTFAKTHDNITLLAGALEGNTLSFEQVTALAQLPTREQLLGQLVGVMAGPARGFVTVLTGVQRQTVYVLAAIAKNKQA